MLVKDVMTKNPITVKGDVSVLEAKSLMNKNKISKLPVVDNSGRLTGIITRNDLIKASPSDATTLDMYEMGYLLSKLTVEKTMKKDVIIVNVNETVENAALLMSDNDIGCLPVMENDLIVGIITESDLFKCFIDMFNARKSGVRAVVKLNEKPGQLARLSSAAAECGANIVSLITSPAENSEFRIITMKLTGLTEEQFKKISVPCDAEIIDIRTV